MRTLAAALAVLAAAPAPARACGGCFQPPDSISSVTDHRMVIALSDQQTTLWDQIQYDGKPADFVWVLPTPTPADVQLAAGSFFDTLEQGTAPRVIGPARGGGGGGGCSFGCGADEAAGAPDDMDSVTVYHTGSVGPYETATVGSQDPTALLNWLTDHGYAVPDAAKPIIAWYVDEGWVFNALRLKPDAETTQMSPVKVVFPGLAPTFPLRMVAAGAGDQLGILLWVIADQRYMAMNYDTVAIDESRLRWSTIDNRSNYRELFAETIAEHGNGAFVVEFAGPFYQGDFPAAAADDVKTALIGQPSSPWLTRLRTSLAPSLLDRDLTLTPSPSGESVSNYHYVSSAQVQQAPLGALSGARSPTALAALGLVAAWALLRRRARR